MEFTLKGLESSKSWSSWMVICLFLLVVSPVPASMHDEGNKPNRDGEIQGDSWLPPTIQPISNQADTYIQNGFFQVGGDGNGITSIKIDPAGSGTFISSKEIIAGRLTLYLLEHVPHDPVGIYYYGVASTPMSMGASSVQWNLTFPGSTRSGSGSACTASLNVSIAGSSLSASMKMDFTVEQVDVYMAGITLQLPFTRSGYDTSISTTCFSRFYTSNFDLVPIEQFKRRSHLEGPSLKGWYDWMVATGVDGLDYDLNFTNFDLRTEFHIQDQMLGLCFPGPGVIDLGAAKHYSREMVATVQSPVPGVPGQYPSFHTSNASLDAHLNAMLLERSFSWSPDTGQADWLEWQNTIVDWMDSPYLENMKNQLLSIQLEDDGYVYTWGDKIGWPFPFEDEDDDGLNDYNTRHYTTNPNFILGCWRYYSWTKDQSFLNAVYPRMYNATEYMRENMTQWDSLFVITAPLHDGFGLRYEKGHPDYNRFDWQSCGSNYWDILPFGYKSAYCNAYIQGALRAMADIERYLGNASRAASLEVLADEQRQTYNEIFWNEQRGRFIGCIDANGTEHDHGFTFLNMEAIYYGMANHSQAMRIYDWMENEPTAIGRKDTYSKFQFAPRATTDLNEHWWHGDMDEFGGQVQDGGAILYTSGYDLRARAIYLGSDNAFQRLEDMITRYALPDKLCGGAPRYTGEKPQQEGPGAVGTDVPFPESGLAPVAFIEGILGITVNTTHLNIHPVIPSYLEHAGVQKLHVGNVSLNLNVTTNDINISYMSGMPAVNYIIDCANISFDINELVANGSISITSTGPAAAKASSLLQDATAARDLAISTGAVFNTTGSNCTAMLDMMISNIEILNQSGSFVDAMSESLAVINLTSNLVNASTRARVTNEIAWVVQEGATFGDDHLLNPAADREREKALEELHHARDSLNRGSQWWFLEHVERARIIMERALELEQEEWFLYASVKRGFPAYIAALCYIFFIWHVHNSTRGRGPSKPEEKESKDW